MLWALGLFLKARKEDKTRKLTFFSGPNRPQEFTGTQRHPERCLAFITQGERLKAQQGRLESLLQQLCSKKVWKTFPDCPFQAPVVSLGKPRQGKSGFQPCSPKPRAEGRFGGAELGTLAPEG